jgi:hypothetical protein
MARKVSDYLSACRASAQAWQKQKDELFRVAGHMCQRPGCCRKADTVSRRDGLPVTGKECAADLEVVCWAHCHPLSADAPTLPLNIYRSWPASRQKFYRDHMRSPQWRKFRQEKKASVGGICEVPGCGQPGEHIHHRHYETLGQERFEDVEVLCNEHHQTIHFGSLPPDRRRRSRHQNGQLPLPLILSLMRRKRPA